jgi:ribosomal protein S18 acetylase RimI-like enzyme
MLVKMTENKFIKIKTIAKKYKYSSFDFLEYEECKNSIAIFNNNILILLYDKHLNPPVIHYATNDYMEFIHHLAKIKGIIRVNFINAEFKDEFVKAGFTTWAEYVDYFNEDLLNTDISFDDYDRIEYIASNDYKTVSLLSKRCTNQSRGFMGETEKWFSDWIKTNKILIIKDGNNIMGYCCVSIYANGTTLWIREIAIDPEYQGKGNGKKLLEQAIYYGKKKGAIKSFLAVDILNEKAIKLYKKYGFKQKNIDRELQMIRKGI